jgi:hypothetical protein
MARIRTIKPEFWTSEQVTECSLSARLLFIGLWNFADDGGNLSASCKTAKMQIFPADNIDVEPLIDELISIGLLVVYCVSDRNYWHITGWHHQVINRPSPLKFPEYSVSAQLPISDHSREERKGKEGKGVNSNTNVLLVNSPSALPVPSEHGESVEIINFPKLKTSTETTELLRCVGEGWNELAHSFRLPTIGKLTDKRKSWVVARAKELVSDYEFENPIDGFSFLFEKIKSSKFLRGEANGFRCSFDFAFNQTSFTKIMEGQYENNK